MLPVDYNCTISFNIYLRRHNRHLDGIFHNRLYPVMLLLFLVLTSLYVQGIMDYRHTMWLFIPRSLNVAYSLMTAILKISASIC